VGDIRQVDQAALRTGQMTTITLLLAAFVIGDSAWWLVALVALAQFLGAIKAPLAPYKLLYRSLRDTGLLKPNLQPDNPEPHRFALAVGTVFNITGALLIASGSSLAGWSLVWVVIALANLNYWLRFCLGCWMYYQLNRLGVPGFSASAAK